MTTPAGQGLCEACGSPLAAGAVFCGSCGSPVVRRAMPAAPADPLFAPGMSAGFGPPPAPPSAPAYQYAGPVGIAEPAPPGRRFAALVIDGAIASAILSVPAVGVGVVMNQPLVGYGVGLAAWLIYGIFVWRSNATKGRTPGKAAMGLRLVDESTGGAPGFGPTLVRFLLYELGLLACWVGAIIGAVGICSAEKGNRAWWDVNSHLRLIIDDGHSAAAAPSAAPASAAGWAASAAPALPTTGAVSPEPGVIAPPPPSPMITSVPGVHLPDEPEPPKPPAPPIASVPLAQHIETFQGEEEDSTHFSPKNRVAPLVFAFDTGERVTVAGSGLVGRNPTPEPGRHYDHLVAIADPDMSVSKNHFEFGIEGAGVWVMDRGSTNGTKVITSDGTELTARPGTRMAVGGGFQVDFGQRTMRVESA